MPLTDCAKFKVWNFDLELSGKTKFNIPCFCLRIFEIEVWLFDNWSSGRNVGEWRRFEVERKEEGRKSFVWKSPPPSTPQPSCASHLPLAYAQNALSVLEFDDDHTYIHCLELLKAPINQEAIFQKMSSWHITWPQNYWCYCGGPSGNDMILFIGVQLTGKGASWLAGMGDMDGGHWIPWEKLRD